MGGEINKNCSQRFIWMIEYLLFALGFVFLLKGADYLVEGASALAGRLGVSKLVIGLTVVAFGTSMPELVVNVIAASGGSGDVALGTIIGSNLSNILLIFGIVAIIHPPKMQHSTVWKEIPFSLLAVLVLFVLANDFLIDGVEVFSLTRSDGLIMLFFFMIFLYYLFAMFQGGKSEKAKVGMSGMKMAALIILGMAGLYLGGQWTVEGAVFIARSLSISEFTISAIIVALGTSLPELVTSVRAAMRKDADLAVGNIVGSNIFNIFLVLGLTSIISPIAIPSFVNADIAFLAFASALLFSFMFIGRKYLLEKWEAVIFLLFYAGYLAMLLVRG
jgi:cation:H+ antiporter